MKCKGKNIMNEKKHHLAPLEKGKKSKEIELQKNYYEGNEHTTKPSGNIGKKWTKWQNTVRGEKNLLLTGKKGKERMIKFEDLKLAKCEACNTRLRGNFEP